MTDAFVIMRRESPNSAPEPVAVGSDDKATCREVLRLRETADDGAWFWVAGGADAVQR